nr:SDR family NAD(P)-dependent oxidoreductase [Microvirga sp. VF16]
MSKTILITGAGAGFGKGAAIGMAKNGHNIIATTQVSSQVTPLREEAKALGLQNFRVERLDLTDPYDIAQAQTWDFDVLWNNAGMGEAGPVWEIPVDLVRKNYEVNVFLPLVLTQGVVRRWVSEGKRGKVVFTSSMGGLFTPANWEPMSRPSMRWNRSPRRCNRSFRRTVQGPDDQSRRVLHRLQRDDGRQPLPLVGRR